MVWAPRNSLVLSLHPALPSHYLSSFLALSSCRSLGPNLYKASSSPRPPYPLPLCQGPVYSHSPRRLLCPCHSPFLSRKNILLAQRFEKSSKEAGAPNCNPHPHHPHLGDITSTLSPSPQHSRPISWWGDHTPVTD